MADGEGPPEVLVNVLARTFRIGDAQQHEAVHGSVVSLNALYCALSCG
jgi:hypothetical protein